MENYTKEELDEKFKEWSLLFGATIDMLSRHDIIIRAIEAAIMNCNDEKLKLNFKNAISAITKEKNQQRSIAGNQFFA
jgi:hypothetical protein